MNMDEHSPFTKKEPNDIWESRKSNVPGDIYVPKQSVKQEHLRYIHDHQFPFLQIINSNINCEKLLDPEVIPFKDRYIIDHGEAISCSRGSHLFEQTFDETETGKDRKTPCGTVANQTIALAEELVRMATERGWAGIRFVDGTPFMKKALWLATQKKSIPIEPFNLSEDEQAEYENTLHRHKKTAHKKRTPEEKTTLD